MTKQHASNTLRNIRSYGPIDPIWTGTGSYERFSLWADSSGYFHGAYISRKDTNKPFGPDNCFWLDRSSWDLVRGSTFPITSFGETKTATDWGRDSHCVVDYRTLIKRVKSGIDPEIAMTRKSLKEKKIKEPKPRREKLSLSTPDNSLPGELWKPCTYNGVVYEMYEVSNLGRVRRLRRIPNGKPLRILTGGISREGYIKVGLTGPDATSKSGTINRYVHALVAEAFIGPRPDASMHINHKNGLKTDNTVDNLEYCTAVENYVHAVSIGLTAPPVHKSLDDILNSQTK